MSVRIIQDRLDGYRCQSAMEEEQAGIADEIARETATIEKELGQLEFNLQFAGER